MAGLAALPEDIIRPAYDRAAVTPGIVHLGIGAFHRAHQAVFIDDCLGRGETGWGIIAASLRSRDTRDAIAPQDQLYTYCERNGESESLRVIGSILETIVAPEDPARLIAALSDPRVRIVTLTVTEKGYLANLAERRLLSDHPDIRHDLEHPDRPKTIHGYLTAAIRARRAAGAVPLTLLSCDNLPSNGPVLKALLAEFAAKSDADLADYIRETIAAPCVMVDRIVPATTDEDRAAITGALQAEDAWPVVAEPYFRWVIEDEFPHGRPAIELSGAEIVTDVEPYEHMKLRMLNGAHTAIAAIGQITGLATVADVFAEPRFRRFIDRYWQEVDPALSPQVDGPTYVAGLRQRFANPSLKHKAVQIASDASQKVPQRILAPLRELFAAGKPSDAVFLALALWIRSCAAHSEAGEAITIHDPAFNAWEAPDQTALPAEAVVAQFLTFERVFGPEGAADPAFTAALTAAYRSLSEDGVAGAIDRIL
ncbi:mannitol dehydrogenase family protein [Xinfangfangia sp. D13-10-4-6]|nr:mannitol dehydrogenase family protein [Pseudogemmobacter hezensis]